MSRRVIQRTTAQVSLFSFLDILGGTIGILTLIIAVFLIQMGQGNQIVQMVSDGSAYQDRVASYIICNGQGRVDVHDDGIAQSVDMNSGMVQNLLMSIRNSKDRYLILGVRPDGFDDFEALRARAEDMGIPVGYEPLDNGWRIRAPGGAIL